VEASESDILVGRKTMAEWLQSTSYTRLKKDWSVKILEPA
jgi:hypothetical protein